VFVDNIPEEADVSEDGGEILAFIGVPGEAKVGDETESLRPVVRVCVRYEGAIRLWASPFKRDAEDVNVILVLHNRAHTFVIPDVHACVRDHAGITTRRRTTKWTV